MYDYFDVDAVQRKLLTTQCATIVESLLRHGADPWAPVGIPGSVSVPCCVWFFNEMDVEGLEKIMEVMATHIADLYTKRDSNGQNFLLLWLQIWDDQLIEISEIRKTHFTKKFMFLHRRCHHDSCNSLGRHALYTWNIRSDEIADFSRLNFQLCEAKPLINTRDIFGITPSHLRIKLLSLSTQSQYNRDSDLKMYERFASLMDLYLERGMETTLTDQHRASVIHYAAQIPSPNLLRILLNSPGEDGVNQVDVQGSSPLHYAAFANCFQGINVLLERGCNKGIRDCAGRTAANLAKLLGFADAARLIGGNDDHQSAPLFSYPMKGKKLVGYGIGDLYKNLLSNLDKYIIGDGSSIDANFSEETKLCSALLASPVLGCLEYQESCFKEETQKVKREVASLIEELSARYNQEFPQFAFEPQIRGSMAEGTKSGPPDEFDFMLIMNGISRHCVREKMQMTKRKTFCVALSVDEASLTPGDEIRHLMNKDRLFLPSSLRKHMLDTLNSILMKPETWQNSCLHFLCFMETKVGLNLLVVYNGPLFKALHISVDLVPCVPLNPSSFVFNCEWPHQVDFSSCRLYAVCRMVNSVCDVPFSIFEVTFSDYESVLMEMIPKTAKEAYVIAKAICRYHRHCPQYNKYLKRRLSLPSSYELKYFLMYAYMAKLCQPNVSIDNISRHTWFNDIISVSLEHEDKYLLSFPENHIFNVQ
ncbi:hypothetical protein CAPTEDRAFT_197175 [Capitella teleta]|uniref:Uncharacterized protein n=1 Tax=Capitella teleta TaxID=283909 RepID=R7UCX1_CAPTE|nr:hypothetical protein CAPTEDRAFT_197175 [Capitella teleta]|eukprot:ELU03921.1 hypothetical protein CAPTEDRAFT_197175 [Capitella teleta]